MGPLLETIYNYFKDDRDDSPLKILWRRISQEMRQCTQCICQHHQAQELYTAEYESSCIGPLLNVLRILDEERVTQHLKAINVKIAKGELDSELYSAEVVSVMFEVLMFPVLLDDQSLVTEFQIFIEAIDDTHELTLAGHQQYPGVYALLFLKSRRVRSIGLRLAAYNGKLRRAGDLEPLQPLLKKCIGYLETEVLPSSLETSRPRVQLERINVWVGIKALLGFLEPPAFEEGILERHPTFLSLVLNHVSDDSIEFSYAVNCLRLLFEMLGYKLWLRTTLSPSVMRNTLLGQCFHTRNEKSHKEIFDLFQPFLQSLEALQDGEHEKQRRHFLYFLLHQVKMSSNFSVLMRKKACQIALLIIHRGYKMNPPCPPYECAHMWGPSLICSLRDSSLHDSLRQPAFDLIHTIIVSDSGALVTSLLRHRKHGKVDNSISADFIDEEDDLVFSHDVEEKDCSCWSEFSVQSKLSAREYIGWICIPMLWLDVLVETDLLVFPISFFKAVLWSLSRFSMVELENSMEMELPVRDWLPSHAGKISFVWEVPTGSDDGGDGKVSKNSIEASSMSTILVKTFKRLAAHFVNQMGHRELWKQLTWEPRMAESLILLLVDPNDNLRQVDRLILEHVSKTRGLANGLQFLCSSGSSLSAIYLGLRHALRLLQLDCVLSNFHKLHHFFFVLSKLLKEMVASSQKTLGNQVHSSNLSSQGGFLRQPVFDTSVIDLTDSPSVVDPELWEQFSQSLSELSWPSLSKCLIEGKGFINNRGSQMTCIRLLEILPVVFERLCSSFQKLSGTETSAFELRWLHDLVDWGKSSNATIARYWKQSLASVLDILKIICHHDAESILKAIQTLISCDDLEVDELNDQVSRLSVSLISQVGTSTSKVGRTILEPFDKKCLAVDTEPSSFGDVEVQVLGSPLVKNKSKDTVIVLSDDEAEEKLSEDMIRISCNKTSDRCLNEIPLDPVVVKSIYSNDYVNKSDSSIRNPKNISDAIQSVPITQNAGLLSKKHGSDPLKGQRASAYPAQSKGVDGTKNESKNLKDVLLPKNEDQSLQKSSSDVTTSSKILSQPCSLGTTGTSTNLGTKDAFLKELEHNDENDPWEAALKAARCRQSLSARPGPSGSKRQVIQLNMPGENKSGFRRYDVGGKRLKPPRLDDWYRPILEMDYFSAVGLSSTNEDENATAAKLKEVPVRFESPDHYVDIFRPLVLEEFKAQLHSSFIEASSSEEMSCGSVSLLSVERVDDFHLVRCVPGDNEYASSRGCSENDLILLTKNPFQNSTHDVHMVGKVERREKDNKRRLSILVIRFYLQNGSSRLNKAKRFLLERSKWYINRIMSITPQLREFQALSSLKDIPILPIILNPSICPVSDYECNKVELGKLSRPLQHAFKSSFNDSQLKAISIAIGTHGPRRDFELSLIQGPPGTGKTRTILAIVSGLLALPSQRMSNADKQAPCSLRPSNTSSSNLRSQTSQSAAIARAWQDAAFARQLNEDGEKNSKFMATSMRVRVLICAQSNAAVDELVSRISVEGLYGSDGELYKPYLVRVGNAKTVHPNSLSFFIDTLVDQRLEEEKMNECDARNDSTGENSTVLRSNLEHVVDRIRSYEAKRAYIRDGNPDSKSLLESGASKDDDVKNISAAEIGAKLNKLYQQKREICKDLAVAQARERKTSEEMKELKNKLRKTILREAEIVVTTLSGCGGDLFGVCSESLSTHKFGSSSEQTLFDAVVIDEAAQALEPATLIPLQLLKSNQTKCIMVGDPKQLPATVLSHVASKFLFECSMFERLQRAGHPVVMLSKQYRMHPEICKFPSLHFYDDKLLNGDQMSSKVAPFHENKYLGPYMFFDVVDGQESHGKSSGAMSLYNECEASVAVEILKFFSKRYPSEFVGGRVGIISPYKSQVSLLRSRFSSVFGPSATADVEFNTVDGFQGREVDILILSTVRASDLSSSSGAKSSIIGFVADVRRMNVALTRAKLSLWILGNAKTLRTNQNWAALIKNAKERNVVKTMARPYESMFKKSTSASRKKSSLTGSDSNHMKLDEKAKGTSECLDQTKGSIEGANEIKTKNVHKDVDPSLKMNHVQDDRGKGKEIVRKHANMSSTAVHVGKGKVIYENSGTKTKLAHVEQEVDINKRIKNDMLKETGDSSECDMEQSKSGIALSCTESNRQGQELNDGCKTTNIPDTPKDLITTRKRQRDAVDALLPSAFIPSKKPEAATKRKKKDEKERWYSLSKKGILCKSESVSPCRLVLGCRVGHSISVSDTSTLTLSINYVNKSLARFSYHICSSTSISAKKNKKGLLEILKLVQEAKLSHSPYAQ
ncbi:Helicase sen1 [Thalictrum thalictroides]|uniref:Helicase sen1 n=1 Tax=Thalictrum thalictroides TaxID=46969 RepID=A0A7J6V157_THATH|nr:Helicase sen1 [Thalictrum thalictroides]